MKPIALCLLLTLYFSYSMYGQEVFIDKNSRDTSLFIGSTSIENSRMLKVFEHGNIVFKDPDNLTQVGLLTGNTFTDQLFKQGLCVEMGGDEPYWQAAIFGKTIRVWNMEENSAKYYSVSLSTDQSNISSGFFALFSTECKTIFGTINRIELASGHKCRVCEYNIPEDEQSLYEVYISIEGRAFKGCATIRPAAPTLFLQHSAEPKLPPSHNQLQNIMPPYNGSNAPHEQQFEPLPAYTTIGNTTGFVIFPESDGVDEGELAELLNEDGTPWMSFPLQFTEYRQWPGNNFHPWAFEPGSGVFVFRVVGQSDSTYAVVVCENSNDVKYLKKHKGIKYETLEKHLFSAIIGAYYNLWIMKEPDDGAEKISEVDDTPYQVVEIKGEWIKIRDSYTNKVKGWIRWRNGNRWMITLSYSI